MRGTSLLLVALAGGRLLSAATYYVAPNGSDGNPGTLAAPWRTIQHATLDLRPGDSVLIRAGTYAEQVAPAVSGTAGAEIVLSAYPGETATIDGSTLSVPEWSGLVHLSGLAYVRVSGLTVVNSRTNPHNVGILADGCAHVVVERNHVSGTNDSGIAAWNSAGVTIDRNEVEQFCLAGWNEGISVGGTADFAVTANFVHDGAKEGICLKDGSSHGWVHGNEAHHNARVGFYVDASGRATHDIVLDGNSSHDGPHDGFSVASEAGGLLENVTLTNNVAYRNGWSGYELSRCCIESHPVSNVLLVNNTAFDNGRSGWGGGIILDNPQATGVVVRNNVCSENLTFQIVASGAPPESLVVDHNLVDGFRGEPGEIRGDAVVEGDPLFVDAPGGDFHLRDGSPAIDSGSTQSAPGADFDGTPRPQGAGIDIGAFERPASSAACQESSTALCLLGSRFRVTATYRDYAGQAGTAQAVPLTNDSGYFWFFGAANVEVVAKMVSFCGAGTNDVAVYIGGLTDVDVTVRVTDTRDRVTREYRNPLGTPFTLLKDGPFACPAVSTAGTPVAPAPKPAEAAGRGKIAGAACAGDATTLCLMNGRFQVSATYLDYSGHTGDGKAVRLTPDTGFFWFFDPKNVEVVTKMVSFCGQATSNVGFYAGGLTDLGVLLTVTDTATGLTELYSNALGSPFRLVRDGPFPCP